MKFLVVLVALAFCYAKDYSDQEVENIMLKLHNDLRQRIRNCNESGVPPAMKMPSVTWNRELAQKAKNLAQKCKVGHDTLDERKIDKYGWVGQNWAGASTLEIGFDLWLSEKKNYDIMTKKCQGVCGHFTQLVWANTLEIGCAAVSCPKPYLYGLSIVCNYGPGGNIGRQRPFVVGTLQDCNRTIA